MGTEQPFEAPSRPRESVSGTPDPPTGAVAVTLFVVLAISVLASLLLGGRAGMWALPALGVSSLGAVARGLAVAIALAAALYGFEAAQRQRLLPRLAAVSFLIGALAAVFWMLGPVTHIGDWDWVAASAESFAPIGKWYGATVVLGLFHRFRVALGFTDPVQSVRVGSSVSGAALAYVYFRTVSALGLPRRWRAWPFLYLSAFGVVGVSLAHVEIYAVVALILCLWLWSGVVLLERPSAERTVLFGALTSVAFCTYAAMALILPTTFLTLAAAAARARRPRRLRLALAAVAAALLVPGLIFVIFHFGPAPMDEPMLSFWARQGSSGHMAPVLASYPDDVFWPLFVSLLRPRYWLSAWHLRDLGLHALISDRAGVGLLPVLVAIAAYRWWRGRLSLDWPIAFVLVAAAPFLAYAPVVVTNRPYPWDWDVFSYVALLTSVLAAGLLARLADECSYGRRASAALVAVAFVSQISGMVFFSAYSHEPDAAGPAEDGLRLAVEPAPLHIDAGRYPTVWFWLYDDTDRTIRLPVGQRLFYQLQAEGLRSTNGIRVVLGSRKISPHRFSCVADVLPRASPEKRGLLTTRAMAATAPAGKYRAVWRVRLYPGPRRRGLRLKSRAFEVVVTK